jgi:hypothetical protein
LQPIAKVLKWTKCHLDAYLATAKVTWSKTLQFESLAKCYDALLLTAERRYNAHKSFESSSSLTKYYDFSTKLQKDESLQEPLDVDELLPLLILVQH